MLKRPETFPDFLSGPAEVVAERLLGCLLEREVEGELIRVRIVETEAYDEGDPASHTFRGRTARNEVMFGESGRLYVYFTYGMHYCCNVVTGPDGQGAAALIRAVEPVTGLETIEARRGIKGKNATNGPAKLCQALAIDKGLNGHDLRLDPLRLIESGLDPGERVGTSRRIGISKAADLQRRFFIAGNPHVSKHPPGVF